MNLATRTFFPFWIGFLQLCVLRVAEVNFGGNNFGPIAIDGIQFHRLDIKLTP